MTAAAGCLLAYSRKENEVRTVAPLMDADEFLALLEQARDKGYLREPGCYTCVGSDLGGGKRRFHEEAKTETTKDSKTTTGSALSVHRSESFEWRQA
jgi:hypothetical protein